MKSKPIEFENILLYPEYCGLSVFQLCQVSKEKPSSVIVAATVYEGCNYCFVLRHGDVVYRRAKHRLYATEVGVVEKGELPPTPVFISTVGWVLPIICYELVYPEDWFAVCVKVIDIRAVLHMVGFPMTSEDQREGWVAMHKAISLVYGCPVVCCCGGKSGRMNITGVVKDGREGLRSRV